MRLERFVRDRLRVRYARLAVTRSSCRSIVGSNFGHADWPPTRRLADCFGFSQHQQQERERVSGGGGEKECARDQAQACLATVRDVRSNRMLLLLLHLFQLLFVSLLLSFLGF